MNKVFEKLLANIPDYKVFLTVDELNDSSKALAEQYPDLVSVFEIGETKLGEKLLCQKIGNGSKNALMFGCPHPNEPIGTMMLEHFTKALAEDKELRDELDYTWYIVKAWDADGLRLNEKWLKGPYTLYNYSRNFFRPAGHKQVDWTFPINYKKLNFQSPVPETQAMMKLIDEIKPKFIYSLHNAGFGGVYWYISKPTPELYEGMYDAAKKMEIPLNLGEPEAPFLTEFAPAVYEMLGIDQQYDYLEKYMPADADISDLLNVGDCSASYAGERYGSFTFLTELPYFYDKRIMDMEKSDMVRKDAVTQKLDAVKEAFDFIVETMEISKQYFDADNPFMLALEAFSKLRSDSATRKMIEENPEYSELATVAEVFDNLHVSRFYSSLSHGMLIRANEFELDAMEKTGEQNEDKKSALIKARDIAIEAHKKLTDILEEQIDYQVVPIKKLVSIQLECGLLMAKYVHDKDFSKKD